MRRRKSEWRLNRVIMEQKENIPVKEFSLEDFEIT